MPQGSELADIPASAPATETLFTDDFEAFKAGKRRVALADCTRPDELSREQLV